MALKNLVSGAGRGAAAISDKFDDLLFVALKIAAIGVACIAVYKYSGLRAPDGDVLGWWMLFGLGVAAIGFEYYGAQTAVDGWYDRSLGALCLGIGLCVPALALSYSNAISSAAVQQDKAAGIQKANFTQTVTTEKAVADAERQLKRTEEARSKMTPQRSAAQARAVVDTSNAHKFWRMTDGCKSTKGPQTRQFCSDYFSAQADIKLWDDISLSDQQIQEAQARLDSAREGVKATPVALSEVRADTLEYAALFGTDDKGAMMMQARHIGITVTLFVTLAGFLSALKRNRGRDLKPWGVLSALRRLWHKIWNGWDSEPTNDRVHVFTDRSTAVAFKAAIDSVKNQPAMA